MFKKLIILILIIGLSYSCSFSQNKLSVEDTIITNNALNIENNKIKLNNKGKINKEEKENNKLATLLNEVTKVKTKEEFIQLEKKLINYHGKDLMPLKVLSSLGRIYLILGEYDKGIKVSKEANKLSKGEDGSILFRLGSLYLEKGDKINAKKYLLKAKDLTPKDHSQYNDLLNTINRLSDIEKY